MLRVILTILTGKRGPETSNPRTWRERLPDLIRADVQRAGAPASLREWNERQFALAGAICIMYADEVESEGTHRLEVLALVAAEWPKHAPRTYAAA